MRAAAAAVEHVIGLALVAHRYRRPLQTIFPLDDEVLELAVHEVAAQRDAVAELILHTGGDRVAVHLSEFVINGVYRRVGAHRLAVDGIPVGTVPQVFGPHGRIRDEHVENTGDQGLEVAPDAAANQELALIVQLVGEAEARSPVVECVDVAHTRDGIAAGCCEVRAVHGLDFIAQADVEVQPVVNGPGVSRIERGLNSESLVVVIEIVVAEIVLALPDFDHIPLVVFDGLTALPLEAELEVVVAEEVVHVLRVLGDQLEALAVAAVIISGAAVVPIVVDVVELGTGAAVHQREVTIPAVKLELQHVVVADRPGQIDSHAVVRTLLVDHGFVRDVVAAAAAFAQVVVIVVRAAQ